MKSYRLVCAFSFLLLSMLFCSCSSPESSKFSTERAIIVITVDSTPILAIWNDNVNLWYLRPTVSINITNRVSVNVTLYKFEFILNGTAGYEVQEGTGERLSPIINNPRKLYPQVNTSFYGYEKFRFTVKGTDDHGNNIDTYADFDVHYVE